MILRSLAEDALIAPSLSNRIDSICQREPCVLLAHWRDAEWPPAARPLMIATVRGGREIYSVKRRCLAVDDDNVLLLNEGSVQASLIRSETEVESFKIFFRRGMVSQVLAPLVTPADRLLEREPTPDATGFEFCEGLRPHDRSVSPLLRTIRQRVASGDQEDAAWLEEQLAELLKNLLLGHRELVRRTQAIPYARLVTRREIHRRVALAVDYIESCYEQPIELETLAQVACLSKFHFLRAFRFTQGITPQHYVRRKRALVAKRLLATTNLTAAEIALRVGYASRTSLNKQVLYWTGASPVQIRRVKCQEYPTAH